MSDYIRCRQCSQMVHWTAQICPYCHIETPDLNRLVLEDFSQKNPATFIGLITGFGAAFVTVCAGAALWPALLVGLVATGIVRHFIKQQIDGNTETDSQTASPRTGPDSTGKKREQSIERQKKPVSQSAKPKQAAGKQICPQQQKVREQLNRLNEQRRTIESQLNSFTFGEAAKQWFAAEKEKMPQSLRIPALIFFAPIALFAVVTVFPALFFAVIIGLNIWNHLGKINAEANGPVEYQISVIDKRIAALQSKHA